MQSTPLADAEKTQPLLKNFKKNRTGAVSSPDAAYAHSAPIRAVAFDASSSRVLSGGDDKAVNVFEKSENEKQKWHPVARWAAAKKVSAACFAGPNSPHAIAADKFGDVVCGPATSEEALAASERPARPLWRGAPEIFAAKKLAPDKGRGRKSKGGGEGEGDAIAAAGANAAAPADAAPAAAAAAVAVAKEEEEPAAFSPPPLPLFGHFCTVVTALSLSADSTALASCDRDGKVRVTRLPLNDLSARGGAPETLAFCLGHTAFCTGVVFLGEKDAGSSSPSSSYLVASSSGDGCVRLWECRSDARGGVPLGSALPCSEAATEAATRRGEACRKVAEVVAARRAAKARVTAALPFGCEGKRAKKEEGEEEEGANGEGADGGGEGDEGEGDEDDFAGLDLPSSLAAPPAVVCLAGDRGRTLVAAVEGEPELLVIDVVENGENGSKAPSSSSSLRVSARIAVTGVASPTSLALDSKRRVVWAAGVDAETGKLVVGFAKLPGEASVDGGEEGTSLPSAEALASLCDAADAGAVLPAPPQISQDLRRSLVSPRVMRKGSK